MTDISRHPLLKQAFAVVQAIENCGASPHLTDAVGQAMDLLHAIDAYVLPVREEPAAPKVQAIQGEALSFMLDPLEQAIESTARVMRDERDHMAEISMTMAGNVPTTFLYSRLGKHLDELLAAQLMRVSRYE
ncbi:hypothetical protein [Pseudomonas petrae]|uniref:Uncharacterized protein n=1 Tax=Pseudomonas petrae TaxID=2912190 RepID=A0ABS9I395_9PSED|nr:hypothetical protein [Pseudomonas petrae]MCF7541829.1 hypothetical protein [Pseudomonas petrae]